MSKPTAIGIHIFAGGFTEGVKKYFDPVAHWEVGRFGTETSRLNHPELREIAVSSSALWPNYSADFFYCNPPCAPWSAAGSRVGSTKRDYTDGVDARDERATCFVQCFDQLERCRPRVMVVESVQRAWTAGRKFVESQLARARAIGYATGVILHDGYDCGLPMHRRRVFFVATTVPLDIRRPDIIGPRTLREALEPFTSGVYPVGPCAVIGEWGAALLRETRQGGKLRETYERLYGETLYDPIARCGPKLGRYKGRPSFLDLKPAWDKPSPVATGGCHFAHPDEARWMSLAEIKTLCGYPIDYEFIGHVTDQYKQISQAVTPPCGAWIASVVAAGLAVECDASLEPDGKVHVYDIEEKGRDEH